MAGGPAARPRKSTRGPRFLAPGSSTQRVYGKSTRGESWDVSNMSLGHYHPPTHKRGGEGRTPSPIRVFFTRLLVVHKQAFPNAEHSTSSFLPLIYQSTSRPFTACGRIGRQQQSTRRWR